MRFDDEFYALPQAEQDAVRFLDEAMRKISAARSVHAGCLALAGTRPGWSRPNLAKRYAAWIESGRDWRSLINRARCPEREPAVTLPEEFIEFYRGLVFENKRKDRPAWRKLIRRWDLWRAGDSEARIPGYDTCPPDCGKGFPAGWSESNLRRLARVTDVERAMARVGTAAALQLLPPIPSTREGVRALEYVLFDDVWHDRLVTMPPGSGHNAPVRLLQLGCLDLATGCYLKFGLRPDLTDDDGTRKRLTRRDMKWLVACFLEDFGYPTDYTMHLVLEHATATLVQAEAEALWTLSNGHIAVCYTSIEGQLVHAWQEAPAGNPRGKAHIESWHNFFKNETGDLAGQTGIDRARTPATLADQQRQAIALSRAACLLPDHARASLIPPYPDLVEAYQQTQDIIDRINRRTPDNMEGFRRVSVWSLPPENRLRPEAEFYALPEALRPHVQWSSRWETPAERMAQMYHPGQFARIHPAELARWYEDRQRSVTVEGSRISWKEGGRRYVYRPVSADQMLPDGTKLVAWVRPAVQDAIHLFTPKGGYVATWIAERKIPRYDIEGRTEAIREKRHLLKEVTGRVNRAQADLIARIEREQAANLAVFREHLPEIAGNPAAKAAGAIVPSPVSHVARIAAEEGRRAQAAASVGTPAEILAARAARRAEQGIAVADD